MGGRGEGETVMSTIAQNRMRSLPLNITTQNKSFGLISRWIMLFLFVSTCTPALTQPNLKFQHLNSVIGLSENDVTCILQDSRGFMWFGTQDGLNKYDGYNFTVYRNEHLNKRSLSASVINDIIEDSDHNLWIATGGGGLNKFIRETETFVRYENDKHNDSTISSNFIRCLLQDREGNIWVGTDGQGLDLFDQTNNRFIHHSNKNISPNTLETDFVKKIFEDSRNNLWIGADDGLHLFNRKNGSFLRFPDQPLIAKAQGRSSIRAIFEDKRQNLWIGTYGGGLHQ